MFLGQFEDPAAAARNTGQRIIGNHHGKAGFFHEQFIDVAQQRAAAGQDDAAFGDIGAEFRRRLFQRLFDRPHDALQGFLEGFQYFIGIQGEAAGHAFGQITALDGYFAHRLARIGRTDFQFDAFRRGLADQDAVVAADVVGDRFVELVAADAHARCVDDAVQRDDRDFGGAAADVEHHRAARLLNRQTGADRGGHGLGNDVHAASAGPLGRFLDGASFDLGGAEGHAHQNSRAGAQETIAVYLFDEVLQHFLGVGEIRDDPVLHRPDRGDMAGGSAQHVFGFPPDRDDYLAAPGRLVLHCDDRWLVENNAALANVDQRIGGSKID